MAISRFHFTIVGIVCIFISLSRAAVLENVEQDVEEIVQKLAALDEKGLELRAIPTCTVPKVENGWLYCTNQRGQRVVNPGNGDRCKLICDTDPFIPKPIHPEIKCTASNTIYTITTSWDATPFCDKYNLMHLQSPSGNNRHTYDDAKALCASKGARLATFNELLDAYFEGLRLCSCGWILTEQSNLEMPFLIYPGLDFSKNMALYPYDNTDRSCGNQGINVCPFDGKYNAWCYAL